MISNFFSAHVSTEKKFWKMNLFHPSKKIFLKSNRTLYNIFKKMIFKFFLCARFSGKDNK